MASNIQTIGGAPRIFNGSGYLLGPAIKVDTPVEGRPVLQAEVAQDGISVRILPIIGGTPGVDTPTIVIGKNGATLELVPGNEPIIVDASFLGFDEADTEGTLIPKIVGGRAGAKVLIDLTPAEPTPTPEPFTWGSVEPAITATSFVVGGGVGYVQPTFSGDNILDVSDYMKTRLDNGTDERTEASVFTIWPSSLIGRQAKIGTNVTVANGDGTNSIYTKETAYTIAITASNPSLEAAPFTLSQLVLTNPGYAKPTGDATHFGWEVVIADAVALGVADVEWTTHFLEVPPEDKWETTIKLNPTTFRGRMRDDAKNVAPIGSVDPAGPQIDYSIATANDNWRTNLRLRWRKAGGPWSVASPKLPPWPLPAPLVPPSSSLLVNFWRPVHLRTTPMNNKPADFPARYAPAPYGGEGLQMAQVFVRGGKRTWFGGDMCGIRFSPDEQSWYNPRARGLRMVTYHAIATDPSNDDRVIVVGTSRSYRNEPQMGNLGAIYLSTDAAHTFDLVAGGQMNFRGRINTKTVTTPLCYLSGGASAATRKWRLIEFDQVIVPRYWKSDDGANNWTSTAISAFPTNLEVFQLAAHPSDQNTIYAATSNGLRRTTNDGGSWTTLGTISGVIHWLWIDPADGNKLLVSKGGTNGGLFYSTNAGSSFTQVLNSIGGQISPRQFGVGPIWNEGGTNYRTIFMINRGDEIDHKDPWLQHWKISGAPSTTKRSTPKLVAGNTAPKEQWFRPIVNPQSNENSHWFAICGGNNCTGAAMHPTDHNRMNCTGYGYPWYSDDGGTNFQPCAGYGGMNSQDMTISDDGKIAIGINDIGICTGLSGQPRFIERGNFGKENSTDALTIYDRVGNLTGVSSISATGVGIIPSTSEVPSAKRGRVVVFAGDYGNAQLGIVREPNAQWFIWRNGLGDTITTPQALYRAIPGFDGNVLFCGTARTLDACTSFVTNATGGRLVCGASKQTSGLIFAKATGTTGTVQRGTNNGSGSWTTWVTGLNVGDQGTLFWLNPADQEMAISRSQATGDLCLIQGGSSASITLNLNLGSAYNPPLWSAGSYALFARVRYNGRVYTSKKNSNSTTPGGSDWMDEGKYESIVFTSSDPLICKLEWCPINPRRINVFSKTYGLPQCWEGIFNSDFTAITWTDITRNFPCSANNRGMTTDPRNGGRLISSGQGIWYLPLDGTRLPSDWYDQLPDPFVTPELISQYSVLT